MHKIPKGTELLLSTSPHGLFMSVKTNQTLVFVLLCSQQGPLAGSTPEPSRRYTTLPHTLVSRTSSAPSPTLQRRISTNPSTNSYLKNKGRRFNIQLKKGKTRHAPEGIHASFSIFMPKVRWKRENFSRRKESSIHTIFMEAQALVWLLDLKICVARLGGVFVRRWHKQVGYSFKWGSTKQETVLRDKHFWISLYLTQCHSAATWTYSQNIHKYHNNA